MQISDPIRNALSPGEQVIWSGQPRQGIVIRGSDALAIPFSLLWAGFAVFWLVSAAMSGAPLPFVLFGVPFVVVGVYIVVGRFFVEAKQRQSTFYALTPQRIIIASGLFSRRVKSLNLKTISDLSLNEKSDGSGTITFGAQHPMAAMFGGMSAWPGAEQYLGPRLDLVPQARTVYESIRRAQASPQ
jgi:Bacterial PH domain